MTQWIKFERLEGNDLPLPKYHTEKAAAFDLAVCLMRPCKVSISKFGEQCLFRCFLALKRKADCYRLYCTEDALVEDKTIKPPALHIGPGETVLVSSGFKLEFQSTHALFIHVRSSTGVHGLTMANGTAVIDSDFRGELFLPLYNRTDEDIVITHGQRVCQAEHTVVSRANIQESVVSKTARGAGMFGSTQV